MSGLKGVMEPSICLQRIRADKEEDEDDSGSAPVRRWRTRDLDDKHKLSGLVFDDVAFDGTKPDEFSELHKLARDAFVLGKNVWEEINLNSNYSIETELTTATRSESRNESCPNSVAISGDEIRENGLL
ncbi:hypothetical protein L2E82_00721 [Cichorium intybus]|uniref:Uncharacterized protein n=1 Tax=Cichorium intybus TaxID=13427 RepID=A0ACB9GWY8_CICIN|nr:hypothetical protein L2E82_00721 [Cichorium intybus]